MTKELENRLIKEVKELKDKIKTLENREIAKPSNIPTYTFSKIRDVELENVVDIEKKIDSNKFDGWINDNQEISTETLDFLKEIVIENRDLIENYNEEEVKAHTIIPILNRIKFKSLKNEFRDFYELPITYKTDTFIFTGTTDFVVSKGLVKSKIPYFFIQEFKRAEEYSNPRPQLLAELIAGVELSSKKSIKGAYVVGSIWHFVILEKLGKNSYQYFISRNFDSSNIESFENIYKMLLSVKCEILEELA